MESAQRSVRLPEKLTGPCLPFQCNNRILDHRGRYQERAAHVRHAIREYHVLCDLSWLGRVLPLLIQPCETGCQVPAGMAPSHS